MNVKNHDLPQSHNKKMRTRGTNLQLVNCAKITENSGPQGHKRREYGANHGLPTTVTRGCVWGECKQCKIWRTTNSNTSLFHALHSSLKINITQIQVHINTHIYVQLYIHTQAKRQKTHTHHQSANIVLSRVLLSLGIPRGGETFGDYITAYFFLHVHLFELFIFLFFFIFLWNVCTLIFSWPLKFEEPNSSILASDRPLYIL